MKKLTNKEREVMELFWQHGPMFVRLRLIASRSHVWSVIGGSLPLKPALSHSEAVLHESAT